MPNKNGLHLITPTSIASTGTGNSSSINTNGSVTFSSCATLSLNGVFSSTYDNYMIVMRTKGVSGDGVYNAIAYQLRASGTDTGFTDYTAQYLEALGTTVSGFRSSGVGYIGATSSTTNDGSIAYFYGPFLTQATATRNLGTVGYLGVTMTDYATTHSLASSYDGFTLLIGSSKRFGGLIAVYGLRN